MGSVLASRLLAGVLAASAVAQSIAAQVVGHAGYAGYSLHQSVALAPLGSGARLEILEDSRITPSLRSGFQRGVPDDRCDTARDGEWQRFCADIRQRALRPALVRIISGAGEELDTLLVERPIADMITVDSTADRQLHGLVVDLTADMGTYSGPYVRLLDGRRRRLDWARVVDPATGQSEEIHLPTTPKAAWQAVRRPDGRLDLLVVTCHPRLDSAAVAKTPEFQITYTRYSLEDNGWRRYSRTVPGFWENEGKFPSRSLFP